jgi:hypothetical protein
LAGAAVAAAARFRRPLTGAALAAVAARRRVGAAGAVLRLRVLAVVVVAEAVLRRPRDSVDALFGVDDVAPLRPVAAPAVARRAVVERPAAVLVVRRARPRTGADEDAALRAAAFSLAFTSCVSSFAALATSLSFWRRSWAISFATAATCRTRVASAPAPALRERGAALARALPPAGLRGARRGAVAGMRRVLVRAIYGVLRVLISEHNGADYTTS